MVMIRGSPPADDQAWSHQFTLSFEDRRALTSAPWHGERRWFRSANVVALEHYRSQDEWRRICAFFWPGRW
jgi:hypothetical protein